LIKLSREVWSYGQDLAPPLSAITASRLRREFWSCTPAWLDFV
jgi:hypothetical protein